MSAKHSEAVRKVVLAPSPTGETGRRHPSPILPPGRALCRCHPHPALPCLLQASSVLVVTQLSLTPPPPRSWELSRSSWKLALVGLLIAGIKQESDQFSHRQAEKDRFQPRRCPQLFICAAHRQSHKACGSRVRPVLAGGLELPPEYLM